MGSVKNYIANENDVENTVCDFIKFCDFVENEKPYATEKGDLSVKACCELNKRLRHPEPHAKATDRMEKYPSIHLWFSVAVNAGIIVRTDAKGGKTAYTITEKYADFKKMNLFSQYLLIFYVWYCHTDQMLQYGQSGGLVSMLNAMIDPIFTQLSESNPGKWIKYDRNVSERPAKKNDPIKAMMAYYYKTAQNFRDLGLVVIEGNGTRDDYLNWPMIEKLKPTGFGVALAKACTQRQFVMYNDYSEGYNLNFFIDDINAIGDEEEDRDDEGEREPFIVPFLECFPKNSIDADAICLIVYGHDGTDAESGPDDDRIFEFKVSLGKKCYRIIRCSPEHTFEDLHLAIIDAFDFDDDHLYAFYLDGKRYSRYAVNAPGLQEPPFADEVRLKDERLRNKQRISYLFDFGDSWEFDVVLDITSEPGTVPKNPKIIKSVGESPEQYPSYEDDEDDYDEEDGEDGEEIQ